MTDEKITREYLDRCDKERNIRWREKRKRKRRQEKRKRNLRQKTDRECVCMTRIYEISLTLEQKKF